MAFAVPKGNSGEAGGQAAVGEGLKRTGWPTGLQDSLQARRYTVNKIAARAGWLAVGAPLDRGLALTWRNPAKATDQ